MAIAEIVACPAEEPDTGIETLLDPAGMVTVAGTVATAAEVVNTLKGRPPDGAGADKVSVREAAALPLSVNGDGERWAVAVTETVCWAAV